MGGVSVLGTEFEAPKRVMRSARDSLERAVGRKAAAPTPIADEGSSSSSSSTNSGGGTTTTTTENDTTLVTSEEALNNNSKEGEEAAKEDQEVVGVLDKSLPPSKTPTLGDRFKNFGRNLALVFK